MNESLMARKKGSRNSSKLKNGELNEIKAFMDLSDVTEAESEKFHSLLSRNGSKTENDRVSDDDITVVEQGYYGNEKLSNYYALKSINIIK